MKLVVGNGKDAETLVETMTPGRMYALVNGKNGNLKSVMFFDPGLMRTRRIDLDHYHLKAKPHVHDGYLEGTFRASLSDEERSAVDRAISLWETYRRKT